MDKKTFRSEVQWKSDSENTGEFKAIFATFDEVDHDQDVTLKGAFTDGQKFVIEGWNHDYKMPVGRGELHFDDRDVWVDGKFFMDTQAGREHYVTAKALQDIGQWSYTFYIEDANYGTHESESVRFLKKLDVSGVSPVTRGAGKSTRTVEIKNKEEENLEDESDPSGNGQTEDSAPSGEVSRALLEVQIIEIED